MNKERRTKIEKVATELERIIDEVKEILSDEEFAYDSMPENLQGSMRGDESQEAIERLDNAVDNLNEAYDHLFEII